MQTFFLSFVSERMSSLFCAYSPSDLNSIYASRTVLRDNAYSDEFIPILNQGGRIMNPILALSASYFKEYLQGTAREQMEKIESNYIVETVRQVRQSLEKEEMGPYTAVSGALLIHHATLNPSMHPSCWSKYLYFRQDRAGLETEAELAMASVSILAMTALPSNGKHHFQRADYGWVGRGEMASMTRVNSTLGLSREMLYYIYLITKRAKVTELPSTHTTELTFQSIQTPLIQKYLCGAYRHLLHISMNRRTRWRGTLP